MFKGEIFLYFLDFRIWEVIYVMDNLKYYIKEDPRKLLKSTLEEISSRLKYKLRKENLVFIYEAKREIFTSLFLLFRIFVIRIHLSNEDELKQLISGQRFFEDNIKILIPVMLRSIASLIYTPLF